MILTLIKNINIIINDLLNLLLNSNLYINNKYTDFIDILANDEVNIKNIIYLSEYIYIINNYIFNIITFENKHFNANINDKISNIQVDINGIINIINDRKKNINSDLCAYIKNSNNDEYLHILYLLFITKYNDKCVADSIYEKMNDKNNYSRNYTAYDYDSLVLNKNMSNPNRGLTPGFVVQSKYINNTSDYTQLNKNNISIIYDNILKHNKFINEYINNYYDLLELNKNKYNNIGVLTDYDKSIEIKLYNNYARRCAYNKGNTNNAEISVFELFNL
jgi:hypothetical protein